MSRRPSRGLVLALLGAWPLLWLARAYEHPGLASVLIPAFVLAIFASLIAYGDLGSTTATRRAQAAFGLIAAGDVFINLTPWPALAAPAFIGAHLCLTAAFWRERAFRGRDLPLVLPPALAVLAFARAEIPRVSGVRATVLVAYLVALLAMTWRALCSAQRTPRGATRVLGASLFFGTDLFTLAELAADSRANAAWIWALYPPALIALAWSCWERAEPVAG
jgi:hypothetical protein